MIAALILAAALAQADADTADAGEKPGAIYEACPDGPPIVPVVPCLTGGACIITGTSDAGTMVTEPLEWPWEGEKLGYLMSNNRASRLACYLGACEADRLNKTAAIEQNGGITPPWYLWVFGLAGALAFGAAVDHFIVPLLK